MADEEVKPVSTTPPSVDVADEEVKPVSTTPPPVDVSDEQLVQIPTLWDLLSDESSSPANTSKWRSPAMLIRQRAEVVALTTSMEEAEKGEEGMSQSQREKPKLSVATAGMASAGMTALKMAKWVGQAKNKTRQVIYKQMRDQYIEALEEGMVVIEVTPEEKRKVSKQRQASEQVNSEEMIQKRVKVKEDKSLRSILQRAFIKLPLHKEQCYRGVYKALCCGIYKHLVPHGYVEQFVEMYAEDWQNDAKGEDHLTFDAFHEAMVTLTDIWCPTCELKDYVSFLNSVVIPSVRFASKVDPLADDFDASTMLRWKKAPPIILGVQPCFKGRSGSADLSASGRRGSADVRELSNSGRRGSDVKDLGASGRRGSSDNRLPDINERSGRRASTDGRAGRDRSRSRSVDRRSGSGSDAEGAMSSSQRLSSSQRKKASVTTDSKDQKLGESQLHKRTPSQDRTQQRRQSANVAIVSVGLMGDPKKK